MPVPLGTGTLLTLAPAEIGGGSTSPAVRRMDSLTNVTKETELTHYTFAGKIFHTTQKIGYNKSAKIADFSVFFACIRPVMIRA